MLCFYYTALRYSIYTKIQGIEKARKFRSSHRVTDSHDREVERDICRPSGPTFLFKQGHPEQDAQDHVLGAFEVLQGGILNNLSRKPVPVLHQPHSEKMFPDVQTEPPVFHVFICAQCLLPSHWAPLQRGWLHQNKDLYFLLGSI